MPKDPAFELFELICQELVSRAEIILPDDELPDIVEDLKNKYQETDHLKALKLAVGDLIEHFRARGSRLPFDFDVTTGRFSSTDAEYVNFISVARGSRGVGSADSKDFEIHTLNRLVRRLTGRICRVGWPRDTHKKKAELEAYLCTLGFEKESLERYSKDGGLDLLWLPPLGAIPIRPLVSIQCKNTYFDADVAAASTARASKTLRHHAYSRGHHHLMFVVFNDYIDTAYAERGGWNFLPLGLSDLGDPTGTVETELL